MKVNLEGLTYQKYGDSPTIKSYTKWRLFEENSPLILPTQAPGKKLGMRGHIIFSGSDVEFNLPDGIKVEEGSINLSHPQESRILGFHFYALKKAYKIRIEEDIREPLIIVSHLSEKAFVSHHLSIEIENAFAPIIIYDISEKGTKSLVVELAIKEGRSEILTLGNHSSLSHYLLRAILDGNSVLKAFTIIKGGIMSHHREDYSLEGEASELVLAGLPVGIGSAIDYITNIVHYGKSSKSKINVHGFSYKNGWVVHRGVSKISKEAKGSSSEVSSHVMILDRGSLGVSVPMLEVDTGDIENASHSSSVTQIDEEALFYLRSRGLNREEALRLLIYGIGETLTSNLSFLKGRARGTIIDIIQALI
ncbi:SufD family Fe-S cluster assembly protein [Pyrococcus sp.]|uniref:SufD family Fe-S cluster assembly protein n=1 Tax=Pyrococcus sp. TaxID=33866 RepID=UPI002587CCE8|nr:SufD family Fe-S cluster assembly protein [Pyrococcus sp.]